MRSAFLLAMIFSGLLLAGCASTRRHGDVVKVLPQFLDAGGATSISPSLYDRDAYQATLRSNPELRSGIRYAVEWHAATRAARTLRLELRGVAQGTTLRKKTMQMPVACERGGRHWSHLNFNGEEYKAFGEITAWRVTLWDGETLVGEQKSFLW